MSIKASVHKFKGMNRDSDVSIANPEYAFENMNIRIEAVDNNTQLSITNEKGNKELTIYDEDGENIISIDGVPIGYGIVDENLVLFTTDAEGSIPDNPTNPKNIFKFTSCIFGGIINNNIRLYVKISELGNPTRLDSITMKAKFSVISFDPITGNLTTTYLGEKSGNRGVNISGIYYDFSIWGTYRYIILHEITFLYMGKILYLSNSSMWLDTNYILTIINDVVKTDYFPIYTSTTGIDVTSGWTGITKTNTGYFVFNINGNITLSDNIYITDEDRYYEYNHFISDWLSTNLLSLPMERPEGDLVVGVVGFKNSDVTNPVTTMIIGDPDIYGIVGENKIVYVNIQPEGADNAYDFLQPTFDDEFLIFNGRNNFHFSTTLIKATSSVVGTPFQINHSAADSVTAYIHIEDFELSYELVYWNYELLPGEVEDNLELNRLGFNSNGDNITQADARVTCNSVFKITYSEGISDWIRISPSASEYNTGDSSLYPNNYINLEFTAEKNTLPTSRSGKVYFSPVSDLVTFEPLMLDVHQGPSPIVQLTFELGYTIPINEYGISINATFSNNSTSTIRLEKVILYYIREGLINTYQTFYSGSVYEDIAGGESIELNTELLVPELNTREAINSPSYVAIEYQVGNTTYGGWNTSGYKKDIVLKSQEETSPSVALLLDAYDDPVNSADENTITLYGNLISNGGSSITSWGFRYSLSINESNQLVTPITTAPITSGTAFEKLIEGLSYNTTYYYQAYATNSIGTGYSLVSNVTTEEQVFPTYTIELTVEGTGEGDYLYYHATITSGGPAQSGIHIGISQFKTYTNIQGTLGESTKSSSKSLTIGVGSYTTSISTGILQDSLMQSGKVTTHNTITNVTFTTPLSTFLIQL